MKLLLYCNKNKPQIFYEKALDKPFICGYEEIKNKQLNGKIVVECDYKIEALERDKIGIRYAGVEDAEWLNDRYYEYKSCLGEGELFNYIKVKDKFYAIHIENLHIFDEPKEIKNNGYKVRDRKRDKEMQIFKVDEWQPIAFKYLDKAPQNMCKVYRLNDNEEYDEYILISVHPEEMARICNGEQTILIRKRVLKEMIDFMKKLYKKYEEKVEDEE